VPEVAYVPLVDAEPCTLASVRRRDAADPVVDKLITLAQQTVAHAAQRHAGLGRRVTMLDVSHMLRRPASPRGPVARRDGA